MKPSLIHQIFLSEKRKSLLLLLKEAPRTREEIKSLLNVSSTSIQPQIKKLKTAGLVNEEGDTYRLSKVGEAVVGNMREFLGAVDLFESNIDYWANRDLTSIPPFLRSRIGELGRYMILEPGATNMFETPRLFVENFMKSKKILTFVSYFHPEAPSLYAGLVQTGVELDLCMTEEVVSRVFRDYPEETKIMREAENSRLFVCRKSVNLPAIVVTDRFLNLKLYEKDGSLRDQLLISFETEALHWGRELFMHYKKFSEPIISEPIFSEPIISEPISGNESKAGNT